VFQCHSHKIIIIVIIGACFFSKATQVKVWHKIYLRLIRMERKNDEGLVQFVDVATIDVDCVTTDKEMLDRIREEYVDPSGVISIAKDEKGDTYKVK